MQERSFISRLARPLFPGFLGGGEKETSFARGGRDRGGCFWHRPLKTITAFITQDCVVAVRLADRRMFRMLSALFYMARRRKEERKKRERKEEETGLAWLPVFVSFLTSLPAGHASSSPITSNGRSLHQTHFVGVRRLEGVFNIRFFIGERKPPEG